MSSILPAAVVGIASGSLSAVATVFLLAPTPGAAHEAASISPKGAEVEGDVRDVLARHDKDIRTLRDDFQVANTSLDQKLDEVLAQLNRRSLPVEGTTTGGSDVELAAAVRDVMTNDGGTLLTTDPTFDAAVADAITRIEEQKRADEAEARRQRELDQIEDRLSKMRDDLGLDQYQESEMRTIMIDSLDRMTEIRDQMRSGDFGRDDMRTLFSDFRTEVDGKVQKVLAPDQYTKYQESNMSSFGGFGGGRTRGGNNGGGPGGFGGGGFGGGGFGGGPGGGN